ncbi:putative integral membrane protein [Theileria parva strain Muguga]|uniref:Uncharacterized protein n=1 Tax=Theileria parva TaxID=5875 RepID=Q4N573_THEPA|nr:putative integral membrane protein [Theileria parva strain Muguga]EAN32700.1 putative integral membrane protein [Theileria parva strain Muguga]|eukprot:XP_764983.1 hypothetical protein [Theileria parva strain Muguga]
MSRIRQQRWIFKDRSAVVSGMFGIPISFCLLILVIVMLGIFILTWLIEGKVLIKVIGFNLPIVIKIMSLVSTLALFAFLINSTGVIYFVVLSTLIYFISHSLLLSGLLEFFFKFQEFDEPFANMTYYHPSNLDFYSVIAICMVRVLLGIPFSYYSLVLFDIRKAGGSGFRRIPAFKLEKTSLLEQAKALKKRYEYVVKRVAIFEMS